MVVAAAVLFNPAVIALSAGWGQVDSVPVFIVLSSLLMLFTSHALRREVAAFALFGIAFAMKPQTCLVFPVMAYALYRRYIRGRRGTELVDGALSIGLYAAVPVAIVLLSGVPFRLAAGGLIRQYRFAADVAPVTSANAFNFWGIVGFWRNDASGAAVMRLGGIPVVYLGVLAFLVGTGTCSGACTKRLGAASTRHVFSSSGPPLRACSALRSSRGCTSATSS